MTVLLSRTLDKAKVKGISTIGIARLLWEGCFEAQAGEHVDLEDMSGLGGREEQEIN